jgi:gluconolactonase
MRQFTVRRRWGFVALSALISAGSVARGAEPAATPFGHIERYDPAFDQIVSPDAKIEKLAEGFTWAEGPVWIRPGEYLLFTDVPENTLYRWSAGEGVRVFLRPSGYAGPDTGVLREPGANGLFLERAGSVLLADSGNRMVARLDLQKKTKTPLARNYQGKRFNSPNDVIRRSDGTVYFTDPPYGLKDLNESRVKELAFNGVYRVDTKGVVSLVDDQLSFPNGIALSPDERTLYVANSDPKRPIWMAYTLDAEGKVTAKKVFADASDLMGKRAPGLPDGMKVSTDGHLFASAPGGILVLTANGQRLGRIETGDAIANCAFGDQGRYLYMTSHKIIARVLLREGSGAL